MGTVVVSVRKKQVTMSGQHKSRGRISINKLVPTHQSQGSVEAMLRLCDKHLVTNEKQREIQLTLPMKPLTQRKQTLKTDCALLEVLLLSDSAVSLT